jgi:hypothetical protein
MLFSLRYFLFKGFRPFLFKFSFKFPIVFSGKFTFVFKPGFIFKVVDFSRLYSDVHSPLVATLQFNEKAAGHDQFQSSDHTIDG